MHQYRQGGRRWPAAFCRSSGPPLMPGSKSNPVGYQPEDAAKLSQSPLLRRISIHICRIRNRAYVPQTSSWHMREAPLREGYVDGTGWSILGLIACMITAGLRMSVAWGACLVVFGWKKLVNWQDRPPKRCQGLVHTLCLSQACRRHAIGISFVNRLFGGAHAAEASVTSRSESIWQRRARAHCKQHVS